MTTDETFQQFVYGARNRIVRVFSPSNVTQAEYPLDARGRRIVETRPWAIAGT